MWVGALRVVIGWRVAEVQYGCRGTPRRAPSKANSHDQVKGLLQGMLEKASAPGSAYLHSSADPNRTRPTFRLGSFSVNLMDRWPMPRACIQSLKARQFHSGDTGRPRMVMEHWVPCAGVAGLGWGVK